MKTFEELLSAVGEIIRAKDVSAKPERQPSARSVAALKASLEQHLPVGPVIVAEKEMRTIILKHVSCTPGDATAVIRMLREKRLRQQGAGYGVIGALLNAMESDGLLYSEWREESSRMTKIFRISEKGTAVLKVPSVGEVGLHGLPETA